MGQQVPAFVQVSGLRPRHMYNRRRQHSVEGHAHTVSSTHDISSHQTPTTLPSRLSTAVTSAARRRRPRHGSADEVLEILRATQWPHDSWRRDEPHVDRYDEAVNNTNTI